MAELFVDPSMTYTREDIREMFIEPLFIDNPETRQLFTVRTGIKSADKLDFFSALEKITKTFARGTSFTSSGGATYTQKTLTVAHMKAQVEENPTKFYDTIKQELLATGVDVHDLDSSPELKQLVMNYFVRALTADLIRQSFFNQTNKETMTNTGGLYSPSGTADDDYNDYKGFWPRIIDDFTSATIPAAQLVDLNVVSTYQTVAAVAGAKSSTLTGTSGTANITINGVAYLATFTTSLTVSAANFVTSHAATILARHGACVVTSSGAVITVTSGLPGMNVLVSAPVNVTGDLAGSTATVTAAVKNTTLVAGGAKAALQAMYDAMPNELGAFEATGELRFLVTRSMYNNYLAYLQTQSGAEAAFSTLVDGVKALTFNGIPVLKRADWDTRISQDFGGIRPHRALLTVPRNLVFGTDGENDMEKIEAWYEKKDQMNYVRSEYKAGTQYVWEHYIVAAY